MDFAQPLLDASVFLNVTRFYLIQELVHVASLLHYFSDRVFKSNYLRHQSARKLLAVVVVGPFHLKAVEQQSLCFVFLDGNQHSKRVIDLRVGYLKCPQRLLKGHRNCVHRFQRFGFDLWRCTRDPKSGVEVLNGLFDVQSSLTKTQDLFVEV